MSFCSTHLFLLSTLLFLLIGSGRAAGDIIEIDLKVDKPNVRPGQEIRLRMQASRKVATKVSVLNFSILRLGYFDKTVGKLVLTGHFSPVANQSGPFTGLSGTLIGPHGIPFEITTAEHVGYEFRAKPNRLGLFMVTTSWSIDGRSDYVVSNPIIIMVSPPVGKDGEPKLKAEWLEKD